MTNMGKLCIFLTLILMPGLAARAEDPHLPSSLKNVADALEILRSDYPQQKIFLHTDKEEYLAGETIWIKGYVLDAFTHKPDISTTNLRVEVLNYREEIVSGIILRSQDGFARGQFVLHDSLPSGNYIIRAHNHWMLNFGEDLIFERQLYVHNPEEKNYIRNSEIRQNRQFNRALSRSEAEKQFAFFPEGGHLVAGLENRIAFKASDHLGAGLVADGVVIDRRGNEVGQLTTEHDGMGVFSITPVAGERYTANIQFEDGSRLRVPLPEAQMQGYVMRTEVQPEGVELIIQANFNPLGHGLSDHIYLVAQSRGQLQFKSEGRLNNGMYEAFVPAEDLPPGIVQFTLFDGNSTPLAERLVFVNGDQIQYDLADLKIEADADRQVMSVEFDWYDINFSMPGSYSLAILKGTPKNEYKSNILTWFYLENDLGQSIENPWYYFAGAGEQQLEHLDLLMMTHGWRRYDWRSLLAGGFPEIVHPWPKGLTLRGKVVPVSSSQPTGNLTVDMSVIQDRVYATYATQTNFEGEFTFTGLDVEGAFVAEMRTKGDLNNRRFRIDMISRKYDRIDFEPYMGLNTKPHDVLRRGDDWERSRRPRVFLSDFPDNTTEPDRSGTWGKPDFVLYMDDISMDYPDLASVLPGRIPGLRMDRGTFYFHGPSSIQLSSEPITLVEGLIVHSNVFFNLNPRDVEKVEAYRGPSTAIFGRRGGPGALNAITRTGHGDVYFEFQLLGYNVPRTFFQAVMDPYDYQYTGVPYTVFWDGALVPEEDGGATVYFPIPDGLESFHVIMKGMDGSGNILYKSFTSEKDAF